MTEGMLGAGECPPAWHAGLYLSWNALHLELASKPLHRLQVVRGVVLARKGLEVPVQQIASLQEGARLLPSDAYRSCLSRVGCSVDRGCGHGGPVPLLLPELSDVTLRAALPTLLPILHRSIASVNKVTIVHRMEATVVTGGQSWRLLTAVFREGSCTSVVHCIPGADGAVGCDGGAPPHAGLAVGAAARHRRPGSHPGPGTPYLRVASASPELLEVGCSAGRECRVHPCRRRSNCLQEQNVICEW
jgi:hypothetical protein